MSVERAELETLHLQQARLPSTLLERGKGCKVLPIATWAGAILPGYPADEETYRKATRLVPIQLECGHEDRRLARNTMSY